MKLKQSILLAGTIPLLLSNTPETPEESSEVSQNLAKLKACITKLIPETTIKIKGEDYAQRELIIQYQFGESNSSGFDTFENTWHFYKKKDSPQEEILALTEVKQNSDQFYTQTDDPKMMSDKGADGQLNHVFDQAWSKVYLSGQVEMSTFQTAYEEALQNAANICSLEDYKPDYTCEGITGENTKQLQSDWSKSSVLLFTKDGNIFCSGTVIPNGQILTARHCVDDFNGADVNVGWAVKTIGGKPKFSKIHSTQAKVIAIDKDEDLAILQLPKNAKTDFRKISSEDIESSFGKIHYALGHPKGRAWTIMETGGFMPMEDDFLKKASSNSISGLAKKPLCWNGGLSGGAIINSEGEITGVVMSKTNNIEMPFITNLDGINNFVPSISPVPDFETEIKTCSMEKKLTGLTPNGAIYRQSVDVNSCN